MEWNAETLKILLDCFLHTLSPNPEPHRQAESYLSEASDKPNFGLAVLHLVAEPNIDDQIRISAAVNFKNHLKSRWISPETNKNHRNSGSNDLAPPVLSPILDAEKEQIKQLILPLMLSSTPRIQSQLSGALVVIGKHDFLKAWPALLPQLVSSLGQGMGNNDYVTVNGILGTANSIFKKFRYQYKTNDLMLDLKYCLDGFAAPLLEIFMRTANVIDSMVGSGGVTAANLKPLMESLDFVVGFSLV